MKNSSIMIVENNADHLNTLKQAFEDRGYTTWICPQPDVAVSLFASTLPHIVLLDLDFEGQNTIELIDSWMQLSPTTKVIVESSRVDALRMREAMDHGAQAYLIKPYTLPPLFNLLEKEIPAQPRSSTAVKQTAA